MTDYIQGPPHGKVPMIEDMGGHKLPDPPIEMPPTGVTLICVVDNGPFEAAAVVDTDRDLNDFLDPRDGRPKVWLAVPSAMVPILLAGEGTVSP